MYSLLRNKYLLFVLAPLLALFMAFPVLAAESFSAELTGEEEVPPVETDATGHFEMELEDDEDDNGTSTDDESGWYHLEVFDGEDITQAHLHCAEEGEVGPAIVNLFMASGSSTDVNGLLASSTLESSDILSSGSTCEDPITDLDSLEDAIEEGMIYVNVHNEEYPNGLIRGQLFEDDNGTSTDDDDNGTSTDDNGNDDDDDNNGTSTDDNGNDDDDDNNGTSTDGNGTSTPGTNPDLTRLLNRLSSLFERLIDLYGQLLSR